jgi:U2-associated protein SR140
LSFLFDIHDKNYLYYKWRTYSYAQGDSERTWRIEPFQMSVGGPVWIPPPLPTFDKEAAKFKRQKEHSDEEMKH